MRKFRSEQERASYLVKLFLVARDETDPRLTWVTFETSQGVCEVCLERDAVENLWAMLNKVARSHIPSVK